MLPPDSFAAGGGFVDELMWPHSPQTTLAAELKIPRIIQQHLFFGKFARLVC